MMNARRSRFCGIYKRFVDFNFPTEAAIDRSWKPGDFEKVHE